MNQAAAALMRRQFGVIGYHQARELGMSHAAIRWRVTNGDWQRCVGPTFRISSAPASWLQRACAALVALGPDAVLSHASAAWVLGLEGFDRPPDVLDVTVDRARRVRLPGVTLHRPLDSVPRFTARGLRVTTLARTFVDLAGVLPDERLEFALDSAHRRHRQLGAWLESYLERIDARGRSGVTALATMLRARRDESTESTLEVRAWRALRRHGLDTCAKQYVVVDDVGNYVVRADFAWPTHRVALHVDSALWHLQEERMTRDALQRMRLQELGWSSLVVTHSMMKTGDAWVARVRTHLKAREPQRHLFS